jgi:hypothetical protein
LSFPSLCWEMFPVNFPANLETNKWTVLFQRFVHVFSTRDKWFALLGKSVNKRDKTNKTMGSHKKSCIFAISQQNKWFVIFSQQTCFSGSEFPTKQMVCSLSVSLNKTCKINRWFVQGFVPFPFPTKHMVCPF